MMNMSKFIRLYSNMISVRYKYFNDGICICSQVNKTQNHGKLLRQQTSKQKGVHITVERSQIMFQIINKETSKDDRKATVNYTFDGNIRGCHTVRCFVILIHGRRSADLHTSCIWYGSRRPDYIIYLTFDMAWRNLIYVFLVFWAGL